MPTIRKPTTAERYGDESIRQATFWDTPLGGLIQSLLPQSDVRFQGPQDSVMDLLGDRMNRYAHTTDDPAHSLGMSMPGMTKVIRSKLPEGVNQIVSYHNKTGERLGHIGYKQAPGRGGRIMDIKMDPRYQKTRYTGELINAFVNEMGPLINDIGAAGVITNSPDFWRSLARKYKNHPKVGILNQMLEFGGY